MTNANVNITEVRKLLNMEPDKKPYLFYFGNFYFVQSEKYSKVEGNDVPAKLKSLPDMDVTVFKIKQSGKEIPAVLKGRKNVKVVEASAIEASDYIFLKTGVRITEFAVELENS